MIKKESAPVATNKGNPEATTSVTNNGIFSYAEGTKTCACRATLTSSGTLMFLAVLLLVLYAMATTKKRGHVVATLAGLLGSLTGGLLASFYAMFSFFAFYIIVPYWLLLTLLGVTWLVFPAAVEDLVFLVYVTSGHYKTLTGEWLVKWLAVMTTGVRKI